MPPRPPGPRGRFPHEGVWCLATIFQRLNDAVIEVLPGDPAAGTTVEGWLQNYASSRDPQLRERVTAALERLAATTSVPPRSATVTFRVVEGHTRRVR
jgi:hypothetical protein